LGGGDQIFISRRIPDRPDHVSAISAGAYTGGVFDFLIPRLSTSGKKARNGAYRENSVDPEQIPKPQGRLKVMSSAFRGAQSLLRSAPVASPTANQNPVPFDSRARQTTIQKCFLKALRNTWGGETRPRREDGQTSDFLQRAISTIAGPRGQLLIHQRPCAGADGPLL